MIDVARKRPIPERSAVEFLAAELFAANSVDYHRKVGETLRQYHEDRLIVPDALWRSQHFHTLLIKYNIHLDNQSQLTPASSREVSDRSQDNEVGEWPDGDM